MKESNSFGIQVFPDPSGPSNVMKWLIGHPHYYSIVNYILYLLF